MSKFNLGMCVAFAAAAIADGDVELGLIPRPAVVEREVPSPDVGAAIGSAIEQQQASNIVDVTLEHAPFGCPPCDALDDTLKTMPGLRVTHVTGVEGPFPKLYYAGRVWHGNLSRGQIEAIIRDYKPAPKAVSAISVGRVQLKREIDALLSRVINRGNETIIDLGSGSVILPATMQQSVSLTPTECRVTFTGTKPRYRYGSGFLAVGVDISSVSVSRTQLVIGVVGIPDVELEVVP